MPKNSRRFLGGCSWDEYCYCCGLPFSFGFDLENKYLADGREITSEEKKVISGKAAQVERAAKWILESVGLDSYNNVIFNLNSGGDIGEIFMKKLY
jgi:hypothetical protein